MRDVVLNRRVRLTLELSNTDSLWEVGVGTSTTAKASMHICRKIERKRRCRHVILLPQQQ